VSFDVIVIGGGAAGCFAAIRAGERGGRIAVIEKLALMKKLAITGKGRCNLTNNCGVEDVLRNIPVNAAFLRSCLSRFTPADAIAFFEGLGVPLKTERGGRVFPVSDKSADIVNALEKRLGELGVEIIRDTAKEPIIENNAVKGVKCERAFIYAPKVILATGGLSYPATGSTGDGYGIARKAGHTVAPPKPALVPIVTEEDCRSAQGLTLKNVRLTLKKSGKPLFSEQGELLFTHFGVSGPLVLSASCYIGDVTDSYTLSIDLKPALDEKTLDARLLRDFAAYKNKRLKNALGDLLPESMIPLFISRSGIAPERQVNAITRAERLRLLTLFKDFSLTVKELRPIEEAIITDGGVAVSEIYPKTMESKLVKGLFFAGEVVDVMGLTGGFNLQIAWATGAAAGE